MNEHRTSGSGSEMTPEEIERAHEIGPPDFLLGEGAPTPAQLHRETGGGDAYKAAMVAHGYVIVTEPAIPAPHPSGSMCSGCPACEIRASKGLPLYA